MKALDNSSRKGFTLLEVMTVVVIMGVLATLGLQTFRDSSRGPVEPKRFSRCAPSRTRNRRTTRFTGNTPVASTI